MKAIVQNVYGAPETLELVDIERPVVGDGDVLLRVHAASVNPLDWHTVRGEPYVMRMGTGLRKPKKAAVMGVDFAGTVESVGANVTQFKAGDEVFGGRSAAFAEYMSLPQDRAMVLKPARVTFGQAASVPVAAVTALQGLRDRGHIQAGQKVLINGASGGVGTFAVQIAKSFGAEVTAVCSTRNVDMVRGIGAGTVIDYTKEDFTRSEQRYDLILDIAGTRSWSECKRVLAPKATFVVVGGPSTNRLLGPLTHTAAIGLASIGASRKVVPFFLANLTKQDLAFLQGLLETGKLRPVIDRTYPLSETSEAIGYVEAGHARGKVVITI